MPVLTMTFRVIYIDRIHDRQEMHITADSEDAAREHGMAIAKDRGHESSMISMIVREEVMK